MESFKRIFKYVWPQWPRVVVVVLSAIVVAALLSLSFMTVIPLLKVMMGEEGLHSWVDRQSCKVRYGMDFYVPDTADFTSSGQDVANYLLITDVEKNSLAEAAGLRPTDRIIGAGTAIINEQVHRIASARLLEELATTSESEITIQLRRLDKRNVPQLAELQLNTPQNEAYVEKLEQDRWDSAKWTVQIAVIERLQGVISSLPREQTRDSKTKAVIFIILVMGGVTIVRCIAKFCQGYMAQKVVEVGLSRLRQDAYTHVMNMPTGFFVDQRPSDVVSRLIRDTGTMGKGIKIMLGKALREPLNAAFMLAAAMWLNWQLALIFMCGAPFVLGLVGLFGKKMKRATRKSLMAWSQMLAKLQETIAGLKIVKVYNQQEHERDNFKTINKRLLKQLLKISRIDAATSPVMEVLGMIAGSAALIVGVYWVNQNRMQGSEFLGLLILLGAAAEAVRKTSDIWNKIQEANAASERVFAVMDEPLEIEKPGAIELPTLQNKIEFKDVVFAYPNNNEPVLRGVNLTVKAGHNVAIVGPNGSGKTTLMNLVPRFYDVDSGAILIDGHEINDCTLRSLRSQIGMVTQDTVTFNDTIAANIAYGRPDATNEEIISAAKRSFAHEFISPLPDGYDTMIGEYGAGLSGGQLQRIIIARAVLNNPAILIFDEATSQVDADSEAKIHKAIEEIMQGRTSFIIAHRFSTVISADVIVVMDCGRIVAQGQHEELIRNCPLYQRLYETQLMVPQ